MEYLEDWNKLVTKTSEDNWTTLSCYPNFRFKNLYIKQTSIDSDQTGSGDINISLYYDIMDVIKIKKEYEIYE